MVRIIFRSDNSGLTRSVDAIEIISDMLLDLFQADDSFIEVSNPSQPNNRSPGSTAAQIFRSTTTNAQNQPLLKTHYLKRFNKSLTSLLTKTSSRVKGEALLEEIGMEGIGRFLGILERSWATAIASGEEVWPVEMIDLAKRSTVKSKAKKGAAKKGKGRKSKVDSEDSEEDELMQEDVENGGWVGDSSSKFMNGFRFLSDGLLAMKVGLLVLTCTSLPKSLYSADLLNSMVENLRFTLEKFIFPVLDMEGLKDLASGKVSEIGMIFEGLEGVLPLVTKLIRQESMSEEILLSMTYFSVSPFFKEGSIGVKGSDDNVAERFMKGLRMNCLGLVKGIYGKYESQRESILEEVLNGVGNVESIKKGKGTIKLVNGAKVHFISILLINLVQTVNIKQELIHKLTTNNPDLIKIQLEVEIQEEEEKVEDPIVRFVDLFSFDADFTA